MSGTGDGAPAGATGPRPEGGLPQRCLNCGAPVPGRFCGGCGQERARDLHVPFHRLAGEALAETFTLDSKLGRTLVPLVFRPGEVTRAYLEGRRARYTSPVKLYLVLSFLFFAVSALRPGGDAVVFRTGESEEEARAGAAEDEYAADELRELGSVGARFADRIEALSREPPEEVSRRLGSAFAEHLPTAMFFLLPLMAFFLGLAFRRSGLFFAEHAVFALHVHSVAFLFLLPGVALARDGLRGTGLLLATVHLTLGARRVYGRGWPSTLARTLAVIGLYGVALGLALAAVITLVLFRA